MSECGRVSETVDIGAFCFSMCSAHACVIAALLACSSHIISLPFPLILFPFLTHQVHCLVGPHRTSSRCFLCNRWQLLKRTRACMEAQLLAGRATFKARVSLSLFVKAGVCAYVCLTRFLLACIFILMAERAQLTCLQTSRAHRSWRPGSSRTSTTESPGSLLA